LLCVSYARHACSLFLFSILNISVISKNVTPLICGCTNSNPTHPNKPRTELDSDKKRLLRTVKLHHSQSSSRCLRYAPAHPQKPLRMMECSTSQQLPGLDQWEILPGNETHSNGVFFLRHKNTGKCLPKNPELPHQPFDCFRYSGHQRVVADSISGLVECDGDFAAPMRINGANHIYNVDCVDSDDPLLDSDVILMTYSLTNGNATAPPVLVWGEKALLALPDQVAQYNVDAEWIIVDIQQLSG
jgi:hypothetical protein